MADGGLSWKGGLARTEESVWTFLQLCQQLDFLNPSTSIQNQNKQQLHTCPRYTAPKSRSSLPIWDWICIIDLLHLPSCRNVKTQGLHPCVGSWCPREGHLATLPLAAPACSLKLCPLLTLSSTPRAWWWGGASGSLFRLCEQTQSCPQESSSDVIVETRA